MSKTAIEWTQESWNPIVGCSIKSPGCIHCYAMPVAARMEAINAAARAEGKAAPCPQYDGTTKLVNGIPIWTGKLGFSEKTLLAPLKRKKPTVYFVNSMSDLFHEDCPEEWIDRVFAVMALSPQHTFQVLTKRAARMREYMLGWPLGAARQLHIKGCAIDLLFDRTGSWCTSDPGYSEAHNRAEQAFKNWPLPNVWLGVSAERQAEADERIPELLQTPAAIRFISAEPLIGPIDLTHLEHNKGQRVVDATNGCHAFRDGEDWEHSGQGFSLDWVIAGGESGPGARPMHITWARSLRDQCSASGVSFFFKQWGNWAPDTGAGTNCDPIFEGKGPCAKLAKGGWEFSENGFTMPLGGDYEWMYRLGKHKAGRLLDGVEHNAMPEPTHVRHSPKGDGG